MLKHLKHEVILYGSEDNEAPCDEFITCITKLEQARTCGVEGPDTVLRAKYEATSPHWHIFNQHAIEAMRTRFRDRDFIAIISGDLADPIVQAFPQAIAIEYAVGYSNISHLNTKKAYASSAWLHTIYGRYYGSVGTKGRFHDRIIPHYLDPDDFVYSSEKDDYFLFVGRLNEDKGVRIAADVARILGKRLVVAGQGPVVPEGCDYRGLIGVEERAKLMSRAKALFVPSLYLEPFGMVAIEGLICGTPIITTDWGGLREINIHGVTGYRCNNLRDFLAAAESINDISPETCRSHGLYYSLDNIKSYYEKWFQDLVRITG